MATATPAAASAAPYPIRIDVPYKEPLSRVTTFFRLLLVIPHLFVLSLLGLLAQICALIAWFAIVFTGTMPRGMFDILANFMRWNVNVLAYIWLLRDEYPPFSWDAGQYPVVFEADYDAPRSRLTTFFRAFMVIPAAFVLYFVLLVGQVLTFIAWFAILFTARLPRGMFDFLSGTLRWQTRVHGYLLLLTDMYPPFSLN